MTISYPFDASRAGAGRRHSAAPPGAAPRGQRAPHTGGNPFQHRRFNVRGWSGNGNGSSTSTVEDGDQAQLTVERQKEVHVGSLQTETGGITMEEVMKDLRILEEQQRESELRLQQACRAKQQNQATLTAFENSLQKSKYSNGRERASLTRKREVLARGQRLSHDCKAGEESARAGLQALGGELNAKSQRDHGSRAAKRHQDLTWKKSSRLKELVESALKQAHDRLGAARERQDEQARQVSERESFIQSMSTKHQATLLETAQKQAKCSKQENHVAVLQVDAADLHEEAADLHRTMLDEANEVNQFVSSSESSLDSLGVVAEGLLSRIQDEIGAKDAKMKTVFEQWQVIREIRTKEGQDTLAPSAPDQELRPVDLAPIEQKVSIEAEALQDQRVSLDAIRADVAAVQQQHDETSRHLHAVMDQTSTLNKSNEAAQAFDAQRNREISNFVAEFERAKAAQDHVDGLVPAIVARRSAILAQLQETQEDLRQRESALSRLTAELSQLKKENASLAHELSRSLEPFNGCPIELEETLQKVQASVTNLTSAKTDLRELEKSAESSDGDGFEAFGVDVDIQQMRQEFPCLDMIPIDRDVDLDEGQQVAIALKALREACENRVTSAYKMGLALREAKEREEAERILVQQAAAEEEKRKEDARVLHLKRRQEEDARVLNLKRRQEAETEEERLQREKRQRRKEQKREARLRASHPAINLVKADEACSAAKPRYLLERFSQASDGSSTASDHLSSSQVKKVHWVDDASTRGRKVRNPDSVSDCKGSQSQGRHSLDSHPTKQPSLLAKVGTKEHLPDSTAQAATNGGGKRIVTAVSTSDSRERLVESLQSAGEGRGKATEPETNRKLGSTKTLELSKANDNSAVGTHRLPLKSSMKHASSKHYAVESSRQAAKSSSHKQGRRSIATDAEPRSSKTSNSRPSSSAERASRNSEPGGSFVKRSAESVATESNAAKPGTDGEPSEAIDDVRGKSKRFKANDGRASNCSKDEPLLHPKTQHRRPEHGSSSNCDSSRAITKHGHQDHSGGSSSQRHSSSVSKSSRSRLTSGDVKSSFNDTKRATVSSADEKALSRGRRTEKPTSGTLQRRQPSKEKMRSVGNGVGESNFVESTHRASTASNRYSGHEGSSKEKLRATPKGGGAADHKSSEPARKRSSVAPQNVQRESKKVAVGRLDFSVGESRRTTGGSTYIPRRSSIGGGTGSKLVTNMTTTSSTSRTTAASNSSVPQRELPSTAKHRRKPSSHGGKKHVNWHIDDSRSSFM